MNRKPVFNQKKEVNIQEELDKGKTKEQIADQLDDNDIDDDGIDDEFTYEEYKSSASCKVSEIRGFVYGGFTSRFWMLRKHINSMDRQKLVTIPFHNWECITLELEFRFIDLVIEDMSEMDCFLKYLIYTLRTIDGKRNSANSILKNMDETQIKGRDLGYMA